MEVRHDVIGVVQRAVDAGIGEHDAGDAADREQEDEADRPDASAAVKRIEPPHIVAIQEKILMPVGTAITIVANTK